MEQTARYRAAEDLVGQFLEEQTVKLPQARVRAGVLHGAFKTWSEDAGQRAVRQNEFAAELLARGFAREKRPAGMFYLGLGLLAESTDEGSL